MSDRPEFEAEPPSKSELKRQSRDLQDLGWELVELPMAGLEALDLPDDLRDAVMAGRRITSHGARVRQRLYIGKHCYQRRSKCNGNPKRLRPARNQHASLFD